MSAPESIRFFCDTCGKPIREVFLRGETAYYAECHGEAVVFVPSTKEIAAREVELFSRCRHSAHAHDRGVARACHLAEHPEEKPLGIADIITAAPVTESSAEFRFLRLKARIRALGARLAEIDRGDLPFVRAGGDVECPDCGLSYRHHPEHPYHTFLTILCDGKLVKL